MADVLQFPSDRVVTPDQVAGLELPTYDIWSLFDPVPKQEYFVQQSFSKRYLLYGGSRGPGKSHTLRWGLVVRLIDWWRRGHENVRVGLFCEDFPRLRDRQITKIKKDFPDWLGELKSTQDEGLGFYLSSSFGGGAIMLRNLDDPSKYQSAEFAGVAIDELTKNELEVFDTLRGSLRWPGIEDTFFWGATNPGGIGHLWVKALWIDRDFTGDFARFQPLADQFEYVKALPIDNPHLTNEYWQDLLSQPLERRRAWVYGDWDVFSGQYFKTLRREIHGFYPDELPESWKTWPRYRSYDWGYAQPASLGWWAVDPDGTCWRYRELYRRGMEVEDFMELALKMEEDYEKSLIQDTVAGHELWDSTRGPSIADRAYDVGVEVSKADKERVAGWDLMRRYINPETRPLIRVSHNCRDWWRTVPALTHDERRVEDVDRNAEDHASEETRYFLMSRPEVPFIEAPKLEDQFEPGTASWHEARHQRQANERAKREQTENQRTGQVMPEGPGYEDPLFGEVW